MGCDHHRHHSGELAQKFTDLACCLIYPKLMVSALSKPRMPHVHQRLDILIAGTEHVNALGLRDGRHDNNLVPRPSPGFTRSSRQYRDEEMAHAPRHHVDSKHLIKSHTDRVNTENGHPRPPPSTRPTTPRLPRQALRRPLHHSLPTLQTRH